jgi:hypothetical protein
VSVFFDLERPATRRESTASFVISVCMLFCKLTSLHFNPELYLYANLIPVVQETKFLGLIFDNKLNFKAHIKSERSRYESFQSSESAGAYRLGVNCAIFVILYRSHVRSKLDYGCIVFGSTRESYLQRLDRIQNATLRVCLGAFRTSSIPSLHVEVHEMPLALCRQKLTLQYVLKLKSNPSNPAYRCVFEPCSKALFDARPTAIPTTGIRMQQQLSETGIHLDCM